MNVWNMASARVDEFVTRRSSSPCRLGRMVLHSCPGSMERNSSNCCICSLVSRVHICNKWVTGTPTLHLSSFLSIIKVWNWLRVVTCLLRNSSFSLNSGSVGLIWKSSPMVCNVSSTKNRFSVKGGERLLEKTGRWSGQGQGGQRGRWGDRKTPLG